MSPLDYIISKRNNAEYKKVLNSMKLSAQLYDELENKGETVEDLAVKLDKNPNYIYNLLSGNYIFNYNDILQLNKLGFLL